MIGYCRFARSLSSCTITPSFFRGLLAALLFVLPAACTLANAQTTTISGTVYMPNGANVLPNALVYVTTSTPAALVSASEVATMVPATTPITASFRARSLIVANCVFIC